MPFLYTSAIKKLRQLKKRVKVIPGGTSAGKTFGILPILIDKACRTHNLEISVVSESIPHLRKGALKDFIKIMKETNRYIDEHYNRTLLQYTFTNGSYIEFFSADQEDKVRGPRRNILYMNEANNLNFETYHQLAIRTSDEIWIDFNPSASFWAHTELAEDEDTQWLTLTYKDNEGLSESIVKEIEKALVKGFHKSDLPLTKLFSPNNIKNSYWANWWKVYGLGQLGSLDGVIFSNWKIIESLPLEAKHIGNGMDFGFTNDPTTLISQYRHDGKKIWDEVIYQKGLSNAELSNLMKQNNVLGLTIADCADPKSIAELRAYGHNVYPATKGPDSIRFGIGVMQQEEFYVTARSLNTIKELRNYTWFKDKKGVLTGDPIDNFNHAIDGQRYCDVHFNGNKNAFFIG